MTFQIALVGCDGLVIASDRLSRYVAAENWRSRLSQFTLQPKYFVSADASLVCFAAGGIRAIGIAQEIAGPNSMAFLRLKDASELEWQNAIGSMTVPSSGNALMQQSPDQLLIALACAPGYFRLVHIAQGIVTVSRINQYFCTGVPTVAQFLPRHLWKKDRTVSELKKLAILTLSYAAREEVQTIGAPFDVMTLRKEDGSITWEEHERTDAVFQPKLERLFEE
jgi:hypothetical protein